MPARVAHHTIKPWRATATWVGALAASVVVHATVLILVAPAEDSGTALSKRADTGPRIVSLENALFRPVDAASVRVSAPVNAAPATGVASNAVAPLLAPAMSAVIEADAPTVAASPQAETVAAVAGPSATVAAAAVVDAAPSPQTSVTGVSHSTALAVAPTQVAAMPPTAAPGLATEVLEGVLPAAAPNASAPRITVPATVDSTVETTLAIAPETLAVVEADTAVRAPSIGRPEQAPVSTAQSDAIAASVVATSQDVFRESAAAVVAVADSASTQTANVIPSRAQATVPKASNQAVTAPPTAIASATGIQTGIEAAPVVVPPTAQVQVEAGAERPSPRDIAPRRPVSSATATVATARVGGASVVANAVPVTASRQPLSASPHTSFQPRVASLGTDAAPRPTTVASPRQKVSASAQNVAGRIAARVRPTHAMPVASTFSVGAAVEPAQRTRLRPSPTVAGAAQTPPTDVASAARPPLDPSRVSVSASPPVVSAVPANLQPVQPNTAGKTVSVRPNATAQSQNRVTAAPPVARVGVTPHTTAAPAQSPTITSAALTIPTQQASAAGAQVVATDRPAQLAALVPNSLGANLTEPRHQTAIDPRAKVADYVGRYDAGACSFLSVGDIEDGSVQVTAYASAVDPIVTFDRDFKSANGFEATIDAALVAPAQCPLIEQLAARQITVDTSALHLDRTVVQDGGVVAGVARSSAVSVMAGAAAQTRHTPPTPELYLLDDSGMLHDLSARLHLSESDNRGATWRFSFPISATRRTGSGTLLLMAIMERAPQTRPAGFTNRTIADAIGVVPRSGSLGLASFKIAR